MPRWPWRAWQGSTIPVFVVLAVRHAEDGTEQLGAAAYRTPRPADRAAERLRADDAGATVHETRLARPAKGGIRDVFLVVGTTAEGPLLHAATATENGALVEARRLEARGDKVEI